MLDADEEPVTSDLINAPRSRLEPPALHASITRLTCTGLNSLKIVKSELIEMAVVEKLSRRESRMHKKKLPAAVTPWPAKIRVTLS